MGILGFIKNLLYGLLTRSSVLYYMYPVLYPLFMMSIVKGKDNSNFALTDKKGKRMKLVKHNNRVLPPFPLKRAQTYPDIVIRDSDILLCGYPKTGCNWTHEVLSMLVRGEAKLSKYGKGWDGMMDILPDILLDSIPSPRILNTHYLFEDLPKQVKEKGNKIVFTARNPKDTVVSYYNQTVKMPLYDYKGDFDDYFDMFINGGVDYGCYFEFYNSWDKVIKTPTTNPIYLTTFEDMKKDPVECIKAIAKFLEIPITDKLAEDIATATSFDTMKKEKGKGLGKVLFRKGKVGNWRDWLSEEQSALVDKKWKEINIDNHYQPLYD